MTRKNPISPAMTAIAAAIAFSTPSFAQAVEEPVAETPAPVTAPTTAEPIVADTPLVADPIAPEAVAKPAAPKATATKATSARSRPAPSRTASVAPAAAAAPAPAAAAVAPVAQAPAVEPLPVEPEAAPVVTPAETADASSTDAMMPALAAGGLAILALAASALLLRRRRRRAAEGEDAGYRAAALDAAAAEPAMTVEREPAPVPVRAPDGILAGPAFAAAPVPTWKVSPTVATASGPIPDTESPVTSVPEGVDVAPGSHVEAAYDGPSADNPSLSLKKRLKRANFFDQREFLVEAGEANPMATDAGLPDAVEIPPAPPEPK